jgi:hypothetical protein
MQKNRIDKEILSSRKVELGNIPLLPCSTSSCCHASFLLLFDTDCLLPRTHILSTCAVISLLWTSDIEREQLALKHSKIELAGLEVSRVKKCMTSAVSFLKKVKALEKMGANEESITAAKALA